MVARCVAWVRGRQTSPLLWLARGMAILDGASMPILAEGEEEPNDTFREQLVASAKAAVQVMRVARLAPTDHMYTVACGSQCLMRSLQRAGSCPTEVPEGFQFVMLFYRKSLQPQPMALISCVCTQEVVSRAVADPTRIAVGGHSYGAFMAANLLAHCGELFSCGIARSGAYNRSARARVLSSTTPRLKRPTHPNTRHCDRPQGLCLNPCLVGRLISCSLAHQLHF